MCAVEWKKLGKLGTFENIGVDKKIVQGEPFVTLLNYVDVYKNKYITEDIPTMRVTAPLKKVTACNVLKGDIFITPTSETKDDIGHTAVALDTLNNVVYSYHLMRYRLSQFNMINSYYINYIFDTFAVKEQIYKFANGLTRFGLSKDKFADIIIPYPSLAKQQEIVSQLDTFTTLISNLESELDMRRKQYEHYRNQLLDFEGVEGVEWKKLGDLGTFENIGVDKKIVQGEPLVTLLNYVDVYKNKYITADIPTMKVTAPLKKVTACNVLKGDIFITPTSETKDDIGHTAVALDTLDNVVYSYHLMRYRLFQFNMTTSHYINYIFDTHYVKEQIYKFANGLTRFGLSKNKFADIIIPYPSLAKQNEIISKLDAFENLIQSLDQEIKLRKQQYEYYREKLLTFEKE